MGPERGVQPPFRRASLRCRHAYQDIRRGGDGGGGIHGRDRAHARERAPHAGEMDAATSRGPPKHMTGQVIRDLRHGSRMILRMPALAAVVVGSLGAGIGANTLVFSWIQAVVFNPIQGVRGASGFHLVEAKSDAGAYLGSSWLEYPDPRDRLRALHRLIAVPMISLFVGEPGPAPPSTEALV